MKLSPKDFELIFHALDTLWLDYDIEWADGTANVSAVKMHRQITKLQDKLRTIKSKQRAKKKSRG